MRRRVVLVPMDFQKGSERALAWAVEFVRHNGGTLEVLHVVPRLHQLDPFFRAGSLPARTVALIRERAALRLAALLHGQRISYRLHVVEGEPVSCILEAAKRCKPELIVVGTHQHRGAARFFLGSVAEKLLHQARFPVVTIRHR